MTLLSYADEQRAKHPVQYEKSRLVIDVTSELKLALEEDQLSVSSLARRLGRGRAIVSRQLSGQENLSLGKLAELAFHLGKRFEVRLVDLDEGRVHLPSRRRHLSLAWPEPRKAEGFRVTVPEPPHDAPMEHHTAA
jgi:transcriptional regulator with XRE-family HTH domain